MHVLLMSLVWARSTITPVRHLILDIADDALSRDVMISRTRLELRSSRARADRIIFPMCVYCSRACPQGSSFAVLNGGSHLLTVAFATGQSYDYITLTHLFRTPCSRRSRGTSRGSTPIRPSLTTVESTDFGTIPSLIAVPRLMGPTARAPRIAIRNG